MKEKITKLLLLEFVDEWESFLDDCQKNGVDRAQFTIVSFQPKVRSQCKMDANELACLDTLPFFNNDSHRRALAKSEQLTHLMAEKLDFSNFSPVPHTLVDTFIYYVRFYINNYLQVLEVLKGIQKKYQESGSAVEIVVVDNGSPQIPVAPKNDPRPYLVGRDRFLASLAREFCRVNRIPFRTIASTRQTPRPAEPVPSTLASLRQLAKKLAIKKLQRLSKQPVVLLAALSYNLERLFGDIRHRFPMIQGVTLYEGAMTTSGYMKFILKEVRDLILRDSAGVISFPFEIMDDLGKNSIRTTIQEELTTIYQTFIQQVQPEFHYEGCLLTTVLNAKVEQDLLPHLALLHGLAQVQQTVLEQLQPNLLLSPVSIDMFQSWSELCRAKGIPAIVIPQKGLVAPLNTDAQMEEYYIGRAQVTDEFQYAVAQTPYVRDYLKWAKYGGTVIETGNLIFSRLQGAKKSDSNSYDDKSVIVYAPSMKSRKSHRFYVLETLDELIDSIADVMNAVAMLPDARLVIRIHPGEPITRQEIETLLTLPENVSISDKGTFEEVLAQATLTISFSSTSIQESLLNGVPVLLYDKWQRYNHLDAPPVTGSVPSQLSAAYYVDEAQKLSTTIRWILDQPRNTNGVRLFLNSVFPARYSEQFFKLVSHYCETSNPS